MDIISSLPDPILCHILSFLPIKFYVTTSVLARRWRYLWTHVRVLRFDRLYYGPDSENRMGFSDMVYRVLLRHNGAIDSLSILSEDDDDTNPYQADAWISTAIAHNVQVLCLSRVPLSQCCFKCKTLVELIIAECMVSAEPGAVFLPRLKKLNLYSNAYENDESLPNLVSGCSAIENLVMERFTMGCDGMISCCICSPMLKSLVQEFEIQCDMEDHKHELVLDVPMVQFLRIQDDLPQIIRLKKLYSLVVANISVFRGFVDTNIWCSRDIFQFFEKLYNTKSLTFTSHDNMKFLDPPFSFATMRYHNLTNLDLEADWRVLTELLQSAYKLESLTVRKVDDVLKCWREPKHLPECLSSSLRFLSYYGFGGREHEFNMVRYILRYAKVLERVKIDSVTHINGVKLTMLQRISDFPRGSRKCGVTFV